MYHSPVPWKVEIGPYSGNDWLIGSALNGKNYSITTDHIHASEMNGADAEDDAKFIVAACNSHDDLLEACKTALEYMKIGRISYDNELYSQLITAIAKAEGQS
jgi:hypothetical protein